MPQFVEGRAEGIGPEIQNFCYVRFGLNEWDWNIRLEVFQVLWVKRDNKLVNNLSYSGHVDLII